MATFKLVVIVISSLFNLVFCNVPVLLWESSANDRVNSFPALHRIRSEDFQQYILKKVHGEQPVPLIAVFSEESLSIEDFSWQDSQGQGYFPQLKYIADNAANVEFLPSVQDPIKTTEQLTEFGYTLQHIDSNEVVDLPDGCGKIMIIKLQEASPDEDRPELLRRHDVKIAEMYSQLLSKCSHVIGFLSGQQSSWVEPEEVTRVRRATGEENSTTTPSVSGDYVKYQDGRFALLFSHSTPNLTIDNKDIRLEGNVVVSGDNAKPDVIKLVAKYNNSYRLTFYFDNKTNGYWYLRSVDLVTDLTTTVLKPSKEIYAPLGWSWHTGSTTKFSNGSTELTFANLQVQPFFLNPGSTSFSVTSLDSVTFFTAPIWSGIFVTFLLALIFTWGITMIMDIRTMDQFDHPKGKTITVTATD